MTDEQILIALAEKLMGWKHTPSKVFADVGEFYIATIFNHVTVMVNDGKETKGGSTNNWNPLTSDTDACAVLDKMAGKGRLLLMFLDGYKWVCQLNDEKSVECYGEVGPECRRHAICLAALKSVGALEE